MNFLYSTQSNNENACWPLDKMAGRLLVILIMMLPLASANSEPEDDQEQSWKINLKEADVKAFITQVSDITGKSFIIDPRVKGRVTVVSTASMTSAEIYELFLSVLQVHGYAAIAAGGVTKITPNNNVKNDPIPIVQGEAGGEELITRVIQVENTAAIELVPILRPLIPQYGHLAGVASANALIITDHAENINRILEIIDRIDGAESEELEVVQLKNAWVGEVVQLLEKLEPVETSRKGGKNKGQARVTVVAEERTNRLIIRGEKAARLRVSVLVAELDKPTSRSGSTKVIHLRHGNAVKVAELIKNLISNGKSSSRKGKTEAPSTELNIQADETLNALVVRADPSDLGDIEDIVRQLDVRRAQVLIEAAIVEVTGDVSDALGIQWASINRDGGVVGGISFSNLGNSLNNVAAALVSETPAATFADGISLVGGERSTDSQSGYGALLQALANSTKTNLLSTPSIMTLDNEEAEIIVGQNVPFITGSSTTSSNGTSNPFQTISREDVGLTLKVVPQINEGDVIRLQVEQEVSAVVPTSESVQSADIITNKRSIKTTILADDGETIVLGGLIQDDYTKSESKVPLLGDLPLLGRLFKSSNRISVKRNLLVFLKPNILRERQDIRDYTDKRYMKMRSIQLDVSEEGIFNIPRKASHYNANLPPSVDGIYEGKLEQAK